MNLIKHSIWAIVAMVSIAVLAMETSKYNIEEQKQKAFMMKACVDAGGAWERTWAQNYNCVRPSPARS